jgi:hypothetical protein
MTPSGHYAATGVLVAPFKGQIAFVDVLPANERQQ